jgi:nucleoside-diphosphate-sugar epimerase
MQILITGGAGFIPSCLADELLKQGHQVVLVDNFVTGKHSNIPEHTACTFIEGDVNQEGVLSAIFKQFTFDYVFHYAALVGVKRTLDNPIMVLDDIQGFKYILELAKDQGVKRVFYSSSSEVYGEPVHLPQHEETTPLNSRLPYAIVKNVGEAYFKSYQQAYGLDYTIFRFFNTYGPKQSEDFVMSKFIHAALKGEDITIYGDGSQTRTFCFIEDNIEACIAAMHSEEAVNQIFNIGNDHISTIKELAEIVIEMTESTSKIIHLPALPEGDMTRRQPDIEKMRSLLKRDLTPLKDGIKKVLASTSSATTKTSSAATKTN